MKSNFIKKLMVFILGGVVALGVGAGLTFKNATIDVDAAEMITDHTKIVNGNYYIYGRTGYLSVPAGESASVAGTAVSDKENATIFTFNGGNGSWTIQHSDGNYLTLKSGKDNGKVVMQTNSANWTASTVNNKIRLAANGSYSLQQNNGGTQFGSYGNTQTDVSLEPVIVTKPVKSVTVSGTPDKKTYEPGDKFNPSGLIVTATYDDDTEEIVTDSAEFSFDPPVLGAGITAVTVTASFGGKNGSLVVDGLKVAELEGKYVKVTSALLDWSGKYLIVNESNNKIMDGSATTNSGAVVGVTIENNEIVSTDTFNCNNYSFTIEKGTTDTSKYTVKMKSGYYIDRPSTGTGGGLSVSNTTKYELSIVYVSDHIEIRASCYSLSAQQRLQYNNSSNGMMKFYTSAQSPIQLYKFEEIQSDKCSVTYLGNGGSGETVDINSPYDIGDEVTILNSTFTAPDYYKFNCWNTAVDGTGVQYIPGDKILSIEENLKLYAQWISDDVSSIEVTESPEKVYQGSNIPTTDVLISVTYAGGSIQTDVNPDSVTCDTSKVKDDVEATVTYCEKTATFFVDVVKAPDGYTLVTNIESQLVDDATVLIVGKKDQSFYAAKEYNYSSTDKNIKAESGITVSNNFISQSSLAEKSIGVYLIETSTIEGDDTIYYSFKDSKGKYLYAASSSSNDMKTQDSITNDSRFVISINNGIFSVVATKSGNRNKMQFNSSSDLFSCYSSGQSPVYLYAKAPEVLEQDGTKVELASDKTFYNATKNTSLLTSDLKVSKLAGEKVIRGSENTTGIGYIAYIYSDSSCTQLLSTIDATTSVESYSFETMQIEGTTKSIYVKVNYCEFLSASALEVVVNRKNPSEEGSLHWDIEPESEYLSALDTFKIKGHLAGSYNTGGVVAQTEPVRIDLYAGSTATGSPVFSATTYYYGQEYHDLTLATFDRTNGYTIPNGDYLSVYQDTSILKYDTDTTFTYRITLLNYTANNYVDKTVTIYSIELGATDNTQQNYYKGGSYTMGADVVAYYGSEMDERAITDTSLYSIVMPEGHGTNKFIPKDTGTFSIRVQLKIDNDIFDAYTVTVEEPSNPTALEILLYDNYHAGDDFVIFAGEVSFGDDVVQELDPYDNNLSFIISPTNDKSDPNAKALKTGDTLLLSQDGWYLFATYTVLKTSVDADPEQISILPMELTHTYTPAISNEFEKVTSNQDDWSGTYLIAYVVDSTTAYTLNGEDKANGNVSATISSNKIANSDSLIKVELESFGDGYSIKFLNGDYEGQYLDGRAASKLNKSETAVEHSISYDTDHIEISCGKNGLKFNKATDQNRFRYYASGQADIQLFKLGVTPAQGDPVEYIKNVIDMARLNNEPESGSLAVCNNSLNLIDPKYWNDSDSSIDKVYESLTAEQLMELRVQDRFGEEGKTYEDTVLKLIQIFKLNSSSSGINSIMSLQNVDTCVWVISVIALVGVTAVGGYFYYRRRKEN